MSIKLYPCLLKQQNETGRKDHPPASPVKPKFSAFLGSPREQTPASKGRTFNKGERSSTIRALGQLLANFPRFYPRFRPIGLSGPKLDKPKNQFLSHHWEQD